MSDNTENELIHQECCGMCKRTEISDNGDELLCMANPPSLAVLADEACWFRGASVDPLEMACIHFKPKLY